MVDTRQVRFSIQDKLFSIVLLAIGIVMAAVVFRTRGAANTIAAKEVNKSLKNSQMIIQTRLQSQFDYILENARGLSLDSRARPLVYFEDAASLQDLSTELQDSLGFDILMLSNSEGKLIARSDKPDAIGRSVLKSKLFRDALNGRVSMGFMRSKDRLYQIVAVPILDNTANDVIRGSLGLAFELSKSLANEIKELTGSEVSFLVVSSKKEKRKDALSLAYSTSEFDIREAIPSSPKAFFNELEQKKNGLRKTFAKNGDSHLGFFFPLRAHDGTLVGIISAYRSKTELLAPFRRLIAEVTLTSLICLGFAILIAYFVARRISKPLISLASVTSNIADGNYPKRRITIRGADEVGILTDAIYTMSEQLQKNAELQDYLANVSESLEGLGPTIIGENRSTVLNIAKTVSSSATLVEGKHKNMPLLIGEVFDGRYEINKLLGSGAMGHVYRAFDKELREDVAIKVLDETIVKDARAEELLKSEVKLARKITHANVVRTFDLQQSNGLSYISMEFVTGYTLDQLLDQKGAFDVSMGLIIMRQICSAITAAHREGVVHGDIKIENVMVNRRGILKVMDFGIASPVIDRIDLEVANEEIIIAGTPAYMAPEAFEGERTHQTDIYSLGVLMHLLLSGDLPFSATSIRELREIHENQSPPEIAIREVEVAAQINAAIQRAIEKSPAERFTSAKEFGDTLAEIQETLGTK